MVSSVKFSNSVLVHCRERKFLQNIVFSWGWPPSICPAVGKTAYQIYMRSTIQYTIVDWNVRFYIEKTNFLTEQLFKGGMEKWHNTLQLVVYLGHCPVITHWPSCSQENTTFVSNLSEIGPPYWTITYIGSPYRIRTDIGSPYWTITDIGSPHWTITDIGSPHWTRTDINPPYWARTDIGSPYWTRTATGYAADQLSGERILCHEFELKYYFVFIIGPPYWTRISTDYAADHL